MLLAVRGRDPGLGGGPVGFSVDPGSGSGCVAAGSRTSVSSAIIGSSIRLVRRLDSH